MVCVCVCVWIAAVLGKIEEVIDDGVLAVSRDALVVLVAVARCGQTRGELAGR
jgi:hypothetical protein